MLSSSYVCGNALPFCPAVATKEISDWSTLYLADKPLALANNNAIDTLYTTLMSSGARPSYNILHISDLNIDYNYVEGASSDCSDLVCC